MKKERQPAASRCSIWRSPRAFLPAIAAATLAFATGCDHATSTASPPAAEQATAATTALRAVRPERKTVRHPIEQPGFNIEAFQETPLYAKISGYVDQWKVDIGDSVHKNDVLAVLYVPEMKVDVEQKQAAVRQAAAQIKQAEATVLTAQAQLDRAKSQFERLERVGKSGVLDQDTVDETHLNYEAARAGLAKSKADVDFAIAQHEAAKAALDRADTMLEYTKILAPYDGVVTQRNVNSGDFVQPAAAGMKGQALFVVDQIDPVRVFVNVPGADAPLIKDGGAVTLELQGAGGQVIQGKVTRNARSLNPQARTLRTEIDLPNLQGKLLPGMYVQARIIVKHDNAWTLPESAVLTEGDQTFCYRVEDGKAVRTPLQIGLRGDGLVEIFLKQTRVSLSSNEQQWTAITGQEEVIAGGATSLTNGQPVRVATSTQ
jgi:RND family efflux transporter MFP subunit